MTRVFISMPMYAKSKAEILEEKQRCVNNVIRRYGNSVQIIDSVFDNHKETLPLYNLAKSISLMADADVVYFAKGWEHTRGCVIEHECATRYGKKVYEEGDDEYCLDLYIEKPVEYEREIGEVHQDECWFVDQYGYVESFMWDGSPESDELYYNNDLCKNEQSALVLKELLYDFKHRRRPFAFGYDNYYLSYDPKANIVELSTLTRCCAHNNYFDKKEAEYLIKKYPQEVLKNFLLYCRK
ncbi:MAG: hypothetical protein IKL88_03475 [Erysipelotrichales bacterium]|nr:hypothetical protein [Erysipelotrichales bacterium]